MAERIRLQKFFSDCGVLSRRAAEAEIAAGHVRVNGMIATIGTTIDPESDRVEYQEKIVRPRAGKPYRYLMLNKPRGYVTTAKDEKSRRTVLDLTKGIKERIFPVGRLDMDSDGLLLLTDDGQLTQMLTHPRHTIPKIYHVTLSTIPTKDQIFELSRPMILDGYKLQPVGVKSIEDKILEMTLYEGRNRQIRKMCEAVNLKITRLQRVAIGDLSLGNLPVGKWRELTPDEITYLYQANTDKERNL